MDVISHALWGGGLFGYRGRMGLALFFGIFPDLISFGPWLPSYLMNNGFDAGPPPLDLVPPLTFTLYNFGHSLLIAVAATAAVAAWRKEMAFAMLGWPFHVILDAPFHSAEYFPTQLFWPVSDWSFDGIAWSHPWVWFPNVAGLLALYVWRWRRNAARKNAGAP